MERISARVAAGALGLTTAAALVVAHSMLGALPENRGGEAVLTWMELHGWMAKVGGIAWIAAALTLLAFAVAVREATWGSELDRTWLGTLFIAGGGVYASVATIASASVWTLASQAQAGLLTGEDAAMGWMGTATLLQFARWGLVVPVLGLSPILWRRRPFGPLATIAGPIVAVALVLPDLVDVALPTLAVWLVLASVAVLVREREHVEIEQDVNL